MAGAAPLFNNQRRGAGLLSDNRAALLCGHGRVANHRGYVFANFQKRITIMAGKFISIVLAASVAVTGLTAAPARAADRDVARALAAIAGIAIVGAVIHDAQKNKRRAEARHHPRPVYKTHRPYRAEKRHHRRKAIRERAYRRGYNYHRRDTRPRRAERRHGSQHGYSARPRRYGN
ncbi:hypothetical protein DC366_10370 [Pelagivirga sediminicola]|uniref:Uncharacterized protein n=1 Tax=Pelagivirga sediminicola TaxID=2170575 RepID=A0A2T7G6J7_9RHOB|nr:NAD(P)-dependent oxidoreductase [Pelagivirga sediminicola]PVA10051.1 hypothetical protein DC366_10370 [Pelagivirga sediminicola]